VVKVTKNSKENKVVFNSPFKDYWKNANYIFLGISFLVLIIGYAFMTIGSWDSTMSVSVSPIVLLITYLILIPFSIFFKYPNKSNSESSVSRKD
jgi:uncharacterized membrane protein YesL